MDMECIDLHNKTVFLTGVAGFIGSNLARRLFVDYPADCPAGGVKIIGIDNMNDYYDVRLKEYRLALLSSQPNFVFVKGSIANKELVNKIFAEYKPDVVVNLAAQAGVRYSITNPDAYIESNLIGFYNILEACRHSYDNAGNDGCGYQGVEHLVYASSSSVYGSNKKVPYSTDDKVDNPVSLYAATKKSNELLAHAYSKLYNIPSTGLRFFTVYGPAGRPDMAYFGFTNKLRAGQTIQIFNYGNCKRDFTYVDDIGMLITRYKDRLSKIRNYILAASFAVCFVCVALFNIPLVNIIMHGLLFIIIEKMSWKRTNGRYLRRCSTVIYYTHMLLFFAYTLCVGMENRYGILGFAVASVCAMLLAAAVNTEAIRNSRICIVLFGKM